jgi:pimeloyl-ACP methyl ester carboxylesterase
MATTEQTTTDPRAALLADLPVGERRITVAGVSTAVLEGGDGPPLVLLHGPAAYAAQWRCVIPALAGTHRVIAPDLPGHGASAPLDGVPDAARLVTWLDELVAATCGEPPTIVGQVLGGAMGARLAMARPASVRRLVLVESLGLAPFAPDPAMGQAIGAFIADPQPATHRALWQHCAHDLDGLVARMGPTWAALEAYAIERARTPGAPMAIGASLEALATPLPPAELERLGVPTCLLWGRHAMAIPLAVAEAARDRYGWPLHVVEDAGDDAPIEQPDGFVAALRACLAEDGR